MDSKKPLTIQVIIGTTRPGRFSEKAASFIFQHAKEKKELNVELVDLRDYPLPFFNEPVSPSMLEATKQEYDNSTVKKWTNKVAQADGYIIVTAEYNHGYPAVLKNALDYVYKQWNRKAVGFVGYGSVGGARAIEQLRQVAVELQMVPIKTAIHIPPDVYGKVRNENVPVDLGLFQSLKTPVDKVEAFLSELIWTSRALLNARAEK